MITKQQIESAMASGSSFDLRMADGREYHVAHRDYISLPPVGEVVFVYDDAGHYTILPLFTMTGLESKIASNGE